MWIIIPLSFALSIFLPGHIAAAWGFLVVHKGKARLTRRRIVTGKPAVTLGLLAILVGVAYVPLLLYLMVIYYPTGW